MPQALTATQYRLVDAKQPTRQLAAADIPRNTTSDVVLSSLKETKNLKSWVKLCNYTGFWAGKLMATVPAPLTQFCTHMGTTKNMISISELFTKFGKLVTDVYSAASLAVWSDARWGAVGQVAKTALIDVGDYFNNMKDAAEFAAVFTLSNVAVLSVLRTFSPWATAMSAGLNIEQELGKYWNAQSGDNQTLSLLKLAMHISYLALATFTISCVLTGVVASTAITVAFLTSATLFGLTSSLYEKLYDPKHENMNVDAAEVMKNVTFETPASKGLCWGRAAGSCG